MGILGGFTLPNSFILPPIRKESGMLELSDAKPSDKTSEEAKRKKAKLLKKLREKESLVNANKQIMVRDRRRPRKSIKEMSMLNKRRRVIKNTARKEIAQQRATIENMRHIELKRYSLEARELSMFIDKVRKVKENRRLSRLLAKFNVFDDNGIRPVKEQVLPVVETSSVNVPEKLGEMGGDKDTRESESMTNLINELYSVSQLIDLDSSPKWRSIVEKDLPNYASYRRHQERAVEAPAELQTSTFPRIDKQSSGATVRQEVRRCLSQPVLNDYSDLAQQFSVLDFNQRGDNSEVSSAEDEETKVRRYNSWREREKRGEPLYSPVSLSPIQADVRSPDVDFKGDELVEKYSRRMNHRKVELAILAPGDMEFRQAMSKVPTRDPLKKAGQAGGSSIIVNSQKCDYKIRPIPFTKKFGTYVKKRTYPRLLPALQTYHSVQQRR